MNYFFCILTSLLFLATACNSQNNAKDENLGLDDTLLIAENTEVVLEKATKVCEIPLPKGYSRPPVDMASFAHYLRNLPLDTLDNTIYSYDGSIISTGGYHHSIIKMDIGKLDLQQCADAIMRLRAEYFYKQKEYDKIHFNFLSDGKPRYYNDYCKNDRSYKKFRKYLNYIFSYANTSSLQDEMLPIGMENLQIGDCFVQKGSPIGHAVIVVDMAMNNRSGEKVFMLAQSYMPAQSIHILSNLKNNKIDPWYSPDFGNELDLPVWTFYKKDLRRFK